MTTPTLRPPQRPSHVHGQGQRPAMTREQWVRLTPEQRARFQAQLRKSGSVGGANSGRSGLILPRKREVPPPSAPPTEPADRHRMPRWLAFVVIVVGVLVVGGAGALLIAGMARPVLSFADDTQKRAIHGDVTSSVTSSAPVAPASASATSTAPPVPANFCADNTEPRRVIVSLKAQHAWYCAAGKTVFDTAVTTGMATDATRTPKGHFTIQTKLRDTVLNPDTGEAYPVKYWIAFKGSEYGFHDASWQKVGFGSKGYQSGGSHGCVHLPLKAVKYLYSWAKVGTAVTIA